MAMIECPTCGLPRTDETAAAEPCPICGNPSHLPLAEEHDDEPDHDRPWVIDEPPRRLVESRVPPPAPASPIAEPRRGGILIAVTIVGFVLGIAAGAGGVLLLQAYQNGSHGLWEFARTDSRHAEPTSPDDADLAPRPREIASKGPGQSRPIAPALPAPAPSPKEPVLVGPAPLPAPVNPFRPEAPRAERLDNPQVYAPFIAPGASLVARGRVRRLIVGGLEKGAVLDCSDLESEEVVVVGKIDGGSRLAVFAPGGKVRFLAKVDGRSQVGIRAPGGSVAFETATEKGSEGSRIGGGAVVELHARLVLFRGHITGEKTRVSVTLDRRGSLEFTRLDDHARLEYAKASPDEGTLKITRGKINGKAVLKYLD